MKKVIRISKIPVTYLSEKMFLTIKTTTQTKTSSWEWGHFDPEDLDKDQKAVRAYCALSPLDCRQIVQDGKKYCILQKW